ncbi:MAG: helix-turn-helix transcriptional regulator [Streptosporangiaceae bacterium]
MAGAVPDRLISAAETASRLGISRRSVERLVERGVLTRVKVCSATRFRASDVAAIVANGTPDRRAA